MGWLERKRAMKPSRKAFAIVLAAVIGRFPGYVRIVTSSPARPAALWGDYFFLDQARHITYANDLVSLDTQAGCPGVCKRHALRFLAGAPFDGGTRVMVWTGKTGQP